MAGQRSSSSISFTYDVFLSFHGGDTGSGFTSQLFKALNEQGIHTFVDDEGLPKGNEIPPALVKVIEESRITIIVFSENYAASSFCLEVLASVLDNFPGNHRVIIPVFYRVDPSDVEKVQKWRNALHQVTNLAGWDFKNGDEHEFQFIEKIVEEVSRMINPVFLHNAENTVGLESRLGEMNSLLELGSDGVIMVGMYGAGGIGKTTLARAVYNMIAHQFEGLCFLDGVRENSNSNGLVHLQEMLLSEFIGSKVIGIADASEGVSIIKHRLHRKNVLLILDDVETPNQLRALTGGSDWFGPGSRVIITTRNKDLLAFHGVERTYKVQALNPQDSLQLLSHQVFKQGNFDPRHP